MTRVELPEMPGKIIVAAARAPPMKKWCGEPAGRAVHPGVGLLKINQVMRKAAAPRIIPQNVGLTIFPLWIIMTRIEATTIPSRKAESRSL